MRIRRRPVVVAGIAALVPALAGLALTSAPAAAAHSVKPSPSGDASAHTWLHADPPLGHPKPSGLKPFQGPPGTKSPWTPLKNPPPFNTPGTMLLESDGSVLVHDEPDTNKVPATNAWYKLTPNAQGSYIDGTWSKIASMPANYSPLYFGSAILPDGRMIVEGGEYDQGKAAWTNNGAIYNPVTNTWATVAPPPGWTNIGDAASEVLPNGTFMLEHPCNYCTTDPEDTIDDALLNAKTMKWTVIPAIGKEDPNDEEGWTLEPNGQLLTVETWALPQAQLFHPSTDSWSFDGAMARNGNPVNPFPVVELGPQSEMPGGNTFVVGGGTAPITTEFPNKCTTDATTQTALYHYGAKIGSAWTAGPMIPAIGGEEYDATDGPGATLPDGNVLFDVSACVYNVPTHFFLYDANTSTLTQIPDTPNGPSDTSYATRLLDLPNGQVLFDDGHHVLQVYTAGGTPQSSWRPSITSLSSTALAPGSTYTLSGKQLAGLDQGTAYGDDVQNATNFPLVRITNVATGVVTYARTSHWTTVSVTPGLKSSTKFTLPAGTPAGKSTLVVVANGIASAPAAVTIP
jgi:hypothetical protein